MDGTGDGNPDRSEAQLDAAIDDLQQMRDAYQNANDKEWEESSPRFKRRMANIEGIDASIRRLKRFQANQVNEHADPTDGSSHGL